MLLLFFVISHIDLLYSLPPPARLHNIPSLCTPTSRQHLSVHIYVYTAHLYTPTQHLIAYTYASAQYLDTPDTHTSLYSISIHIHTGKSIQHLLAYAHARTACLSTYTHTLHKISLRTHVYTSLCTHTQHLPVHTRPHTASLRPLHTHSLSGLRWIRPGDELS